MSTKNKILIAIGIIIFILVDTTLKISSAIGIVAYLILRKQMLEKHPKDFVDGIKFLLIVPIIQLLLLFFIYSAGNGCINVAGRIDNLHNVSTYTPYLGDLGEIVDFANQNGALPEIERSTSVISLIDSANTINLISIVSCILTIILIFIELYGIYRIGKLTKRQMRISNIAIALIFLVFSIFLGRFLDMYVYLLSKIYPIPDRIPIIVIIPIITILIVSLAYRFYSKALDFLFASTENQTSETKESPKTSDENQAISQSSTPHENQVSDYPKKHSIVPYIVLGIGCIIFITIMIISFNKRSNNDDPNQPIENITTAEKADTTSDMDYSIYEDSLNMSEEMETIDSLEENQFEYINEVKGSHTIEIEWPTHLIGINDIKAIQSSIIYNAFDKKSHNLHQCIMEYFQEQQEEDIEDAIDSTYTNLFIKFSKQLGNYYIFEITKIAYLGGGTGASYIEQTDYVNFNSISNRELTINELFENQERALNVINSHISLDEYESKATKIPNRFSLSTEGITFIFPKYSIGYGYQGEVRILVTYQELLPALSEQAKNSFGL